MGLGRDRCEVGLSSSLTALASGLTRAAPSGVWSLSELVFLERDLFTELLD